MPLQFNWKPYAVGVVIAVAAVAAFWIAGDRQSVPSGQRSDAYASEVVIASPSVSAAESMMAGGVVYYDGTIENHGDRTLTACTVALTFPDIDGAVLETDQRSLLAAHLRPIPPHSQRTFEI